MSLTLNVLCQSPVGAGRGPQAAVQETIALAKTADELGYHRFWVAEHHNDPALASAAPEVMMSAIAANTSSIKVGSGGVLLPYYAPYKVAEQFHLLASLFPGRVDLGMGRAGGSEGAAPQALGLKTHPRDAFGAMDEVLRYTGHLPPKGLSQTVRPQPVPETPPEPWVLGTSPASAKAAGERGLPYAFGAFIDPRHMMASLAAYHQNFRPSRVLKQPRVALGWVALAASTREEAERLNLTAEAWFVDTFLRGQTGPFQAPEAVAGRRYAPHEQVMLQMRRKSVSVGTADEVIASLRQMSTSLAIDEFFLVTLTHDPEARRESYRLIAQANAATHSRAPSRAHA